MSEAASPSPPTRPGSTRAALVGLLLANVALACGPWMVRLAQSESQIGPLASAFWRLALAMPVLLVLTARERPGLPVRPVWLIGMALLSGIFFAADLGMWHVGILHTRLANATLLGNVTAILFPLYGFVVARHWPNRRQAGALALAAVGAILLMGRSYELSRYDLVGDLLCLLAGVCYTVYLIMIDRTRAWWGPLPTFTVSVAAGVPALLSTAWALGEPVWPHSWGPLILMTLGSQLIGQGLILYAVARVSPLIVGLMLLIQPVVASTIGWTLYGEHLSGLDAVGAATIAVAMLLAREAAPLKRERNRVASPA